MGTTLRQAPLLSLAIVRGAAILVPPRERDRFRREWLGELAYAANQSGGASRRLVRRSFMALRDALTLRSRRARGDGPGPLPGSRNRGPQLLEQLLQDVRFGWRSLRKSPGFAAIAILTIALGIGATTTIFSLVDGILLKPLPYREPANLVAVWPEMYFSSRLFDRTYPALDSYDELAIYGLGWERTWLTDDGAEQLRGPTVTAGFFDVLGLPMILGRGFQRGDDAPGATSVVLTERFWRERLNARNDVIGMAMRIGGREHTVIGVGGSSLAAFQPGADIVMPWILDPASPSYGSQDTKMIGRLRDGVAAAAASAEVRAFAQTYRQEYNLPPDFGDDAEVVALQTFLVGDSRPMLLLLFGAVGLTLLIASANVANLLLARALARQREVAVRVALGARGGRLARQILTETSLLALLGAIPGVALALVGLDFVVSLLPAETPRIDDVAIDMSALFFSVGVALLTGWVVGVIPAFQAARADVREALTSGGRTGSDSAGRQRLRQAVVLSEIALAVTLVAGAGLLVKSFVRLTEVDPGFQPQGLVTFNLDPARETLASPADARAYYTRMHERIDALPGVVESASVWKVAFSEDGGINGFWRDGQRPGNDEEWSLVRWRPVTANYFATAGLRLARGRFFGPDDVAGEPVTVISAAAAEELFPGEDPIGEAVFTTMEVETPLRVIGVVEDLKLAGLDRSGPAVAYRPYAQLDGVLAEFQFPHKRWMLIRTEPGAQAATATSLRAVVRGEDATALFADFVTMPSAISGSLAARRATMTLLTLFALSAITLGAIGIYGVMAYAVRQRAREIGIRVALGATSGRVIRDVIRDALRVAAGGVAVGLILTYAATRSVQEFLFEVDALDPTVLGGAAAAAVAVAISASLLPAWRAARVDPATTLGSDD
jgi:predicted permease